VRINENILAAAYAPASTELLLSFTSDTYIINHTISNISEIPIEITKKLSLFVNINKKLLQ